MQATVPTGPAVNFAVTGSANTKAVPGGNVLVITVLGTNVYVSCGVAATASTPSQVWQNILFAGGSIQTWRRPPNASNDNISVIAADGSSTGTVQIVPVEGN